MRSLFVGFGGKAKVFDLHNCVEVHMFVFLSQAKQWCSRHLTQCMRVGTQGGSGGDVPHNGLKDPRGPLFWGLTVARGVVHPAQWGGLEKAG